MKTAKVEFEMEFDSKYTDEQITNYIKYEIGACHSLSLDDDIASDLNPNYCNIEVK